jgi:hypothetical protein
MTTLKFWVVTPCRLSGGYQSSDVITLSPFFGPLTAAELIPGLLSFRVSFKRTRYMGHPYQNHYYTHYGFIFHFITDMLHLGGKTFHKNKVLWKLFLIQD